MSDDKSIYHLLQFHDWVSLLSDLEAEVHELGEVRIRPQSSDQKTCLHALLLFAVLNLICRGEE